MSSAVTIRMRIFKMDCLTKYFVLKPVVSKDTQFMMEVDGTAESRFYAVINKSAILDSAKVSDGGKAKLVYLIRQDNEDKWEGELNTDKEGVEEMNSNSENTCCYCDKHLHFELDMRKSEAAKRK